MLDIKNSVLLIIDMQEKLVKAASNGDEVVSNAQKLVEAANILHIPILVTEQYPKGLGKTVLDIPQNSQMFEKTSFSALNIEGLLKSLDKLNRKQILICGIETHICVLQTALDLIQNGFEVYLVKDASSSRTQEEHNNGVELLKQYNVKILSTEITLFQWLKTSKHPSFKQIQALIK